MKNSKKKTSAIVPIIWASGAVIWIATVCINIFTGRNAGIFDRVAM